MFLAFLKLGKRVLLVTHIDHQHRPPDINMQFLFRNTQISGHALHVSFNSVSVCRALHQQLAGT